MYYKCGTYSSIGGYKHKWLYEG